MSRPKVHEKRDSDEGTAAAPRRPGRRTRDRKGDQRRGSVAVAVAREREKKREKHSALIG